MADPAAERVAAAGPETSSVQAEPAPPSAGPICPQPLSTLSRRVVLTLLGLTAVYLVVRLWTLVTLVVVSGLVAYVLEPLVEWLSALVFRTTGRALPRSVSILLVFLCTGGLVALAGYLLLPPLVDQVAALVRRLPEYYERVAAIAEDVRRMSRARLPEDWRRMVEGYLGQAGGLMVGFLQGSLGALVTVVTSLLGILLVPILTFFMLRAAPGIRGGILAWFAPRFKPEVDFLLAEVNFVMLKFLRGRLIVASLVGVLIAAGTWALDMPYPLVLGLAAGLLDLIPFIGPFLAAIPAVVLALLDDPSRALWVAGLYFAVQQFEQFVLSPQIEGGALELNPAVVIVAGTAAGSILGALGVLLSIPLTALVRIGLLYLRAKLLGEPLRSIGEGGEA